MSHRTVLEAERRTSALVEPHLEFESNWSREAIEIYREATDRDGAASWLAARLAELGDRVIATWTVEREEGC